MKPKSIKHKLSRVIVLTALLVFVLSSIVLLMNQFFSSRQAVKHELNSLANVVSMAVAPALLFRDETATKTTLQALKGQSHLMATEVYLRHKTEPFAALLITDHTEYLKQQYFAVSSICGQFVFNWRDVLLCKDVELDGEVLGLFLIKTDLTMFYHEIVRLLLILWLALMIVCLISILMARQFGNILINPVVHLASIAKNVTVNENYTIRARKFSDDEVGGLAGSFNKMLEQIQLRDEKLLTYSNELEIKVAERTSKLAEKNQALTDSIEELKAFSYIVSHDLRAPMINIQGFASELSMTLDELRSVLNLVMEDIPEHNRKVILDILDEEIPSCTHFISGGVAKMNQLLTAILNISRVGRQEISITEVNVQKLVEDNITAIQYQSNQANAVFEVKSLPMIKTDNYLLIQVFANLLSNAVKYLDAERPGKIEIWAEKQSDFYCFFVRDNGLGIAEKDQSKVFDMFRRGSNHVVEGEGVGLNYVKSALKRLGGTIELESTVGRGSVFSFILPVEPELTEKI